MHIGLKTAFCNCTGYIFNFVQFCDLDILCKLTYLPIYTIQKNNSDNLRNWIIIVQTSTEFDPKVALESNAYASVVISSFMRFFL